MIRVNVLPNGRLVLPVALRKKLGVQKGGHVMAELVGNEVHLTTPDAALDRARPIFREYVAPGSDIAQEVIADRRKENDRESGDRPAEGERS